MNLKEYSEKAGRRYVPLVIAAVAVFVLCILFFFLVYRFQVIRSGIGTVIRILMPFVYGGVFAYLLRPLCKYFDRNFKKRMLPYMKDPHRAEVVSNILSVVVSLLLVVAAVIALITLSLQSIITSVVDVFNSLPGQIAELTAWLESIFVGNEVVLNYINSISASLTTGVTTFFSSHLLPNIQNVIGGVSAGAVTVVTQVVNLFVGAIVAIYLLLSRNRWRAQLKLVISSIFKGKGYRMVVRELRFIDRTFTDYISGRILDSVIVGVIVYVVCLIMGIEDAALIGMLNGLTNIIPYFGPYIGAIPSAMLILMDDPIKCVWFIVFILILQQIDGNIICPKILSESVGLSSFWVLFSTLLFGGLFGFVGLLVGVPVFVVIYDLIKKLIYWALNKRGREELILEYENKYHPQEKKKEPQFSLRKKDADHAKK